MSIFGNGSASLHSYLISKLLWGETATRNDAVKDMLEESELELCAVLRQTKKYRGNDGDSEAGGGNGANSSHGNNNNTAAKSLLGGKEGIGIAAGLLGLEFGGGTLLPIVLSRAGGGLLGSTPRINSLSQE